MSAVALGLWLAGVLLVVAPVWAGLRQMRWLRRTARPWRRGQTIADDRARAVSIQRRVAVLLHEAVAGPVTCGVRHAVILLPLDAESWSRADLDRALVHELEHVRRHDWLTQCFARALCACYWFHPLVWITRRQIALEAERACDDAVLTASAGAWRSVCLPPRINRCSRWRIGATSRRASVRCSMPISRAGVPARSCSPLSRRHR
jgi:beta-lactamase regulating signal transducer with metallopeptidase domain